MKKITLLAIIVMATLGLFLFLKPNSKKPEVVAGIAKKDLSRKISPSRTIEDSIGASAYDLLFGRSKFE